MRTSRLVFTLLGTGAAIAASAAPAAAHKATPHIAAKPDSVMVNGTTQLVGGGFAKHTKLTLSECGSTVWIVPQEKCDTTNMVTIKTNGAGAFKAAFKVQLCPAEAPPPPPTEETCYIGVVHPFGVDQEELVGAAKITVTWP